jgi:hypothetical protein
MFNRNSVGIAAAIALVAGYLGVAAVAHLAPFAAKAAPPAPSQSQGTSPPASTNSNPASSPAASASTSPPTQFDTLMAKIPPAIRTQPNPAGCKNPGTAFGATAVIQCQHLQGIPAQVIIYYQYSSRTALAEGLSTYLTAAKFRKIRECTTGNSSFTDFLADCQSDYTIKRLTLTGSVAEYTNGTQAIIVSTDNNQHVMAALVGTNAGELLAYWNQQEWLVHP